MSEPISHFETTSLQKDKEKKTQEAELKLTALDALRKIVTDNLNAQGKPELNPDALRQTFSTVNIVEPSLLGAAKVIGEGKVREVKSELHLLYSDISFHIGGLLQRMDAPKETSVKIDMEYRQELEQLKKRVDQAKSSLFG